MRARVSLLTGCALVAFAANSIICRLALRTGAIDPAGFTAVRLVAGALCLVVLTLFTSRPKEILTRGSWQASTALFVYAAAFSFSYLSLDAGIGALFLFGAVQITMIAAGVRSGECLHLNQVVGSVTALVGLAFLSAPGATAPPIWGAALMVLAGIAWGVYSFLGRGSKDPGLETASNFVRAVPLAAILAVVFYSDVSMSVKGVAWAVLSGAIASGLGYVIWYAALTELKATTAAIVQLAVPVLAAAAGVVFLHEVMTLRLAVLGAVVLTGVLLAIVRR
jgi:drug/metabolite transporter (DMT)-like permease